MNCEDIGSLVNRLPGVYQPIYGHPEFSTLASRPCVDRLRTIMEVYFALAQRLMRPVRVLDLGCAQGYFVLHLASCGAHATGVDVVEENIALCEGLAREHPGLQVGFLRCRIEDFLPLLAAEEYDLVLALSVLHHLCYTHGMEQVRKMVGSLAEKIEVLLFEAALREEPLYWASSLPHDPRALVADFPFVHALSWHEANLSEIRRPLFFCSARWWFLGGELEPFASWEDQSSALAGLPAYPAGQRVAKQKGGTRRYFFSERKVAKYLLLEGGLEEDNREEIAREVKFLSLSPPVLAQLPKLQSYEIGQKVAWLVREKVPGVRLAEAINTQREFDRVDVVKGILDELQALEERGLYHRDLRVWNVLLREDGGATLLDYGSISDEKRDLAWPHDVFLSFLVFVWEILSGQMPSTSRLPRFSPGHFPERFRDWVTAIWDTPSSEWSFKRFRELFQQIVVHPNKMEVTDNLTGRRENRVWEEAIERYLGEIREKLAQMESFLGAVQTERDALRVEREALTNRVDQLQTKLAQMESFLSAVQTERDALRVEREALTNRVDQLQAELRALYASTSWRVTAPLRWIKDMGFRSVKRLHHRAKQAGTATGLRCRRILWAVARRSVRWAAQRSKLRSLAKKILQSHPAARAYLKRLVEGPSQTIPEQTVHVRVPEAQEELLPASARKVLREIRMALDRVSQESGAGKGGSGCASS